MKHFSHFNTAISILNAYEGTEPFSIFLKTHFRANKKYGSKDRKRISQLCYGFFRLGKALPVKSIEERILLGLFLTTNEPDELLHHFHPELNSQINLTLDEKLKSINDLFDVSSIFPFASHLSENVEELSFAKSHLIQPFLYLRVRPGHQHQVESKLKEANVSYNIISPQCIALLNSTKVDDIIAINKEAVVQDLNSQRVGELFNLIEKSQVQKVWDCCAASGGKSIMAYDWNPSIHITASDIREPILVNLNKRFKEAGIKQFESKLIDLQKASSLPKPSSFDLVIADVPCSGSGTWSRTPEQLFYFEEEKIQHYHQLQQKILMNAIPAVRPNGYFLFITCSVFKEENEENLNLLTNNGMEILQSGMLKGYDQKADTLFAALFKRTL